MGDSLEGGCLCGAIRYCIEGVPENVGHCHCWQCRKAGGAAFATFAWVAGDKISWSGDAPVKFASSDVATRWFCKMCGSMLAFKYNIDDGVDVAVGSLDNPSAIQPTMHVWYDSRLKWLHMDGDGLIKHQRNSPESLVQV